MFKRLIYIAYFLEVGLLLILVPWSAFWERNYFARSLPLVRSLLEDNFLRGAVSGLGLVNLMMGFVDLSSLMSARRAIETGASADADTVGSSLVNEK